MPSMDEYAASGGYARDSQAQVNLGGSGFYSSGGGSSSTGSSSSSNGNYGWLINSPSYSGDYTSNTPIVAREGMAVPQYIGQPVSPSAVNPPVVPVVPTTGIFGDSKSMISVVIFGGIFVLAMSLFKG